MGFSGADGNAKAGRSLCRLGYGYGRGSDRGLSQSPKDGYQLSLVHGSEFNASNHLCLDDLMQK